MILSWIRFFFLRKIEVKFLSHFLRLYWTIWIHQSSHHNISTNSHYYFCSISVWERPYKPFRCLATSRTSSKCPISSLSFTFNTLNHNLFGKISLLIGNAVKVLRIKWEKIVSDQELQWIAAFVAHKWHQNLFKAEINILNNNSK